MEQHYSMVISWSPEDACFVVYLPDFKELANQPCTDGQTYEEAARSGQEVIESLIEWCHAEGVPLPSPRALPMAEVA